MYRPYLDSGLNTLTVKQNRIYEIIGIVWTLAGYLVILRDYYELFLYNNVILIMFQEQQQKEFLSFTDTYWNIYERNDVMSRICFHGRVKVDGGWSWFIGQWKFILLFFLLLFMLNIF